jgi:hypothetical protein
MFLRQNPKTRSSVNKTMYVFCRPNSTWFSNQFGRGWSGSGQRDVSSGRGEKMDMDSYFLLFFSKNLHGFGFSRISVWPRRHISLRQKKSRSTLDSQNQFSFHSFARKYSSLPFSGPFSPVPRFSSHLCTRECFIRS